ncbi:MAG: sugar phosphate isomerase/epimerase [Clostridia bacterium]|nr:sugar phosphate isomerase/epimerase [Clostridia bacterium]
MINGFKLAAFADEASSNFDGQIKAMERNGIEMLEIRGVDGENVAKISTGKAKEVKKKLDDAGLSVWSIGSPVGKTDIRDDFSFEAEQFKRVLETAYITQAKCIRLFSFYGTDGKAEYRDEVMERLSKYIDMAKGSGVILCHENEKGIYGDVASRCAEIHRALPEIKAVFDPANFIQSGQDTLPTWDLLKEYVYYFHIKDCVKGGGIVPAGHGDGHISEILARYKGLASNVLTLEPHLTKFVGLAALEGGDKSEVGGLSFKNNDEAFDCAVDALKKIITNI